MVAMTYTVVVTREKDAWLADVPALPGAHIYARSLDGLMKAVREVIILMDDLEDDAAVDLEFTYEVEDTLLRTASEIGQKRLALAARERELQAATTQAVHELGSHGYSVRDAARLLAMTPGRVSQLANAGTRD